MAELFAGGWPAWLALLLSMFYFVSGILNWYDFKPFRDGYARWRLPTWFGRLNGTIELITAVLLFIPPLRAVGLVLSFAICAGVFTVLVYHRDYSHLPPGIILYLVTIVTAWGLFS